LSLGNNKVLDWKFKLDKIRSKLKGGHANFQAQIRYSKQTLIHDISYMEFIMEQRELSDAEISIFLS
jgi:hypothetical protein